MVKDIFDVAGTITGRGNPDWLATIPPATANAPAVQALLDAGARMVGKTITEELAFGMIGINPHYGMPEERRGARPGAGRLVERLGGSGRRRPRRPRARQRYRRLGAHPGQL